MSRWNWLYKILINHGIAKGGEEIEWALGELKKLRESGELVADEERTCNEILGKDRKSKASQNDKTNVKEQMQAYADKLKGKKPVASISDKKVITDYDTAILALKKALFKNNGVVTRKSFGDIQVSSRLKEAKRYIKKPTEIAMFAAVPAVIKNGVLIATHENHKGNQKKTFTFAGNVKVGDKTYMVAVVVQKTTDNFYRVHRVIMPEDADIKKDTDS